MLIDSIRHSVFCAGPKVKVVENPALRQAAAAAVRIPSVGSHTTPPQDPLVP